MGRKALPENKKTAQLSITIDRKVYELIKQYAEIELIPVSRYISRVLQRYFEMK
jgi:hypothetical protein